MPALHSSDQLSTTADEAIPAEEQAYQEWCAAHKSAPVSSYVAVFGRRVLGPYKTPLEAEEAGFREFGRVPLCVFEIGRPTVETHTLF